MIGEYFAGLARDIEAKLAAEPAASSARKVFALEVARLGVRLYSPGRPVAWCGVLAPFDLLNGVGVTSCFAEFVGAMLAGMGAATPPLEGAEQAGYAADTCAYHRAVVGAAMQGMMPVPDFLVATTTPCTGGLAAIENLARLFRRELLVLQIPRAETEAGVRFLAGQLERLARFAAGRAGTALDAERVAAAVELSNLTRGLMVEIYDLARKVPSPVGNRDLANFGIVVPLLMGTQAGVDVARATRDELAARVGDGKSGVAGERFRLLWVQNRIQFPNPLLKLLEDEYRAVIVVDELNDVTWEPIDPADPYPGMARRAIGLPLNGPAERRVARLRQLATEYRVDGVIHPCHWGCRQGTGIRGLVQRGFRETGIPVLNLEVDCIDARSFSEGQLRTRLEAFLELIAGRPRASA
ncbi:MAG: 2-hydroxyacyl-CoA dehydratase [Deltaproteobacteria bacterium]|nr:2-hydroxyacyl-CoA dehydratase [Deltaproteobacteria bacterium]